MEIINTILAKIDKRRISKGLSIFRLTELSGLSENTIYNWYNNGAIPSVMALNSVCKILEISLSELFATESKEVISLRQQELLKDFDIITESQQKIVLAIAREFANRNSDDSTNEDNTCQDLGTK